MSQQNARDAQEIDEQSFEKVWDLCVMLGIPEDTLEKIADDTPYDDEFDRNFADNVLDIIVDKLDEMGYPSDGDATYDSVYWFAKGYNTKKEDDEYFKKFDRDEFKIKDPLDEFKRMNVQDKFEKERKNEKIKREDDEYFKKFDRKDFITIDPLNINIK